jgi:glycosyltransferase involved in cell wall biosynthesis
MQPASARVKCREHEAVLAQHPVHLAQGRAEFSAFEVNQGIERHDTRERRIPKAQREHRSSDKSKIRVQARSLLEHSFGQVESEGLCAAAAKKSYDVARTAAEIADPPARNASGKLLEHRAIEWLVIELIAKTPGVLGSKRIIARAHPITHNVYCPLVNILFLDQFSDMGGAQRCLVELLPAIRERGWTAHLAIPGDGVLRERSRPYCASIESLLCGPFHSGEKQAGDFARFLYQLPSQARTISRMIKARNIDLLYVNGPRLLPAAALANHGLPVVFHAHSRVTQPVASFLAARCLRFRNATVIASSAFVADLLRDHVSRDRLHVVYNGVAGSNVSTRAPRDTFRIGIIGRIAPEKGQLEFARAAKLVLEHARNCEFIVCGAPMFSRAGYDLDVRAAAQGLPIQFLGWRDDIADVLAGLDVLAVPSGPNEATTRTILEAYSTGVPVVAFRSGGIPEVVEHGRTGWLVDPTPEALAAKLGELIAHPGQLLDAGQQARRAWRGKYTLDRYQNEVVSILDRHHQRTPFQSAGTRTPA